MWTDPIPQQVVVRVPLALLNILLFVLPPPIISSTMGELGPTRPIGCMSTALFDYR